MPTACCVTVLHRSSPGARSPGRPGSLLSFTNVQFSVSTSYTEKVLPGVLPYGCLVYKHLFLGVLLGFCNHIRFLQETI